MGVRLQGGFTSRQTGAVYTINVHDTSYSGSITDFDLAKDGLVEEYNHDDKGRNHTILTSSMKVNMLIKNNTLRTFISDVVNSAEGRFFLEILKDGNKYWYGYVLPDLFTLQDIPNSLGPVLTVKATDGIGRLKEIDYNNSGTRYTGKATFIEHLFNILGKIGLDSFYGSTEDYLITHVDWRDQNHVYDAAVDPLSQSRFDHRALVKVDSSGEVVYRTTYEVLDEICRAWNCRFLYSDGTYKFAQVNAYETNGNAKVIRTYDKNQNESATSTSDFAIWNKTTGNLDKYTAGTYGAYHNAGNFKYYPALREVEVQYEHFGTANLIPGEIWTQVTAQTATYDNIDFNGGVARLLFTAKIESRADWTTPSELQILTYWFRVQFRVGNYYLRRGYTVNGGQIIEQAAEWTTDPANIDVFSEYMYYNNASRITNISIPTPPLEESGQLYVTITRAGAYNTEGQQVFTGTSDFTPYYTWSDVSVVLLVDGNLEGQTNVRVFRSTNDDGSTNSKREEIPLLIGDGPTESTFGAIQVYNTNDAEWVASSGWRKENVGTYVPFGQLLADEILSGQKYAIERYLGTVTGDFVAHGRLRRYESDVTISNYIFVAGRHNIHLAQWEGEWVKIDVDNTGISNDPVENYFDPLRPDTKSPVVTRVPPVDDDAPPIRLIDSTVSASTQITINGPLTKNTEISTIPIDAIESDGYIFAGDEILIQSPTGETIPVKVLADVKPGDTSVSVVAVTPGVDVPEGSTLTVSDADLLSFVQTSRKKTLKFFSDIRVTDAIVDGNALFFFRVDESSEIYLDKLVNAEIQVYTPGSGGGTYDFEFKVDGSNIFSTSLSETTEISRQSMSYSLTAGLYTFHVSNISGTVPIGVNFCLEYVKPLKKLPIIRTDSSIAVEYVSEIAAFQAGVRSDRLYSLSLDNVYGMPHGLVARAYSSIGFPSDSRATTVATDEWYSTSIPNDYGLALSAIRAKGYTGTAYADDTAAAAGGIDVNEPYILSAANPYGLPAGFVKLRKV